jgi:PAS domain S-box-containing protein
MKKLKIYKKPLIAVTSALAIILAFVALAFLSHEKRVENIIMSHAELQMLTISQTNALRIKEYVLDLSRSLKIIAADQRVKHNILNGFSNPEIDLNLINNLYEHHKEQVDAFTILDDSGIMLHRYPFWRDNKSRLGEDHADKPGVAYVVKEHKPYISEIFYNRLGELAFSISEPVFDNDKFIGLVRWMISLSHFTDYFIQPIIAGNKIRCIFVINEDGTIIIHNDPEQIGKNIIMYKKEKFHEFDWSALEGIAGKMTKGESGTGIYNSAFMAENELKIKKKLIAYVPVKMGSWIWSISNIIDYSEIAGPIELHEADHIKITVIIAGLFLISGIVFYRLEKIRSAELSQKNIELEHEITERIKTDVALRESKQKLSGIVESVTDAMVMIDSHLNIVWVNDVAKRIFGHDIFGKKCYSAYHGRHEACELCIVKQCFDDGNIHEFETKIITADGRNKFFFCTASVSGRDKDGRTKTVVEFLRDITEKKQTEQTLQIAYDQAIIYAEQLREQIKERSRAEKEKEVLLREIHHRVKNNMQVISSLLKLQSGSIEDKKFAEMLKESQDRIRAMALVHERLYKSKDLANIDFDEYIKYLVQTLFRSYAVNREKIRLKLNIERVMLKIDKAIPCGLIVNELILNSLKYAFADGDKGEIEVSLLFINENEVELTVSDDGIGIPEGFDFNNSGSLGLKLVNILTDQIDGKLDLDKSKGTKFQIRFKI